MGSGRAKLLRLTSKLCCILTQIKISLIFIGFDIISMIKLEELTVEIEDDASAVDRLCPICECLPFLPKAANSGETTTCMNPSIFVSWTVNEKSTSGIRHISLRWPAHWRCFLLYLEKKEDGSFRPGRSSQWRFSRMLLGL